MRGEKFRNIRVSLSVYFFAFYLLPFAFRMWLTGENFEASRAEILL